MLQTVAWTNMLAENLQTASLTEAVGKTFDGDHPCCLCQAISAGKQAEKKAELPMPLRKIEFVSAQPLFVFRAPQHFRLVPEPTFQISSFRLAPPVPPPRNFPA